MKKSEKIFSFSFILTKMFWASFALAGDKGMLGNRALTGLDNTAKGVGFNTVDPNKRSFIIVLGTYVNGLLTIIGVLFMLLVMYGGFLWMTGAGNDERIRKGQKMIAGATIGISVIILARVIVMFILNAFAPAF